ncbi:MAG: PAS domain-containing protein, partial [bacterium]
IKALKADIHNKGKAGILFQTIRDMIYKEEHILLPMSMETLTGEEWVKVRTGEEEIGYAWIKPAGIWPEQTDKEKEATMPSNEIKLDTGALLPDQINLIINHLPVEISFIDPNDEVRFYSHSKGERIFPRSPGVIGRKVQKCHPPKSVHLVEKILNAFKDGSKDSADFWINLKGRMVYIRYFAVKDNNGAYQGTLEVTQDITEIKKISGERRLLDWE